MNVYFWAFVAYAILIAPVSAHIQIRIDRGVRYRIGLRTAGLPVMRKKKKPDASPEATQQMHRLWNGETGPDAALLSVLFAQGHLMKLLRLFDWRQFEIKARISFEDAALTALVFSLLRAVLYTGDQCGLLRADSCVQVSFQGEGTTVSLACIASARLGSIGIAAARLWLAAAGERARRLTAEEEKYAASH